jgi:hypothetical protein
MRRVFGGPWLTQYIRISRRLRSWAKYMENYYQQLDEYTNIVQKFVDSQREWRRLLKNRASVIKGFRTVLTLRQEHRQQQPHTDSIACADKAISYTKLLLHGVQATIQDMAKIKRQEVRRHRRHHNCRHHHHCHHSHQER